MKINTKKQVEVDAKILSLDIKVRDEFAGTIVSSNDEILCDKQYGYVPDFMPHNGLGAKGGSNMGDYLILDIDLDTGQILNWVKPTPDQIEKFINGSET